MFSTVLDIFKSIFDILTKHKEIEKEKRENLSLIFNEISLILQDTSEKLKKDEYPHGNCVVLQNLSNSLVEELKNVVDSEVSDRLHRSLLEASNIEKSFHNRKDLLTVKGIEEAAGEFKSISLLLKL